MPIYPHYPKPVKNKISQFMTFFKKRSSWLDGLYARSYTMKMGHVKMPGLDLYLPNEPELIQRVLVSEAKDFPKNQLLHEILSPLLGNSIFTTNGSIWKRQRELLNPSFEMVRISHVFGLMNEAAQDMLKRLHALEDGAIYNVDEETTHVTADIIFRTILSEKLEEEESKKIIDAFSVFQEKSAKIGMQRMFRIPKFISIFSGEKQRQISGSIIRNALGNIIRPRYDAMQRGEESDYKDILSSLLKVKDEETKKPFPFTEILDQIAMLFLAGHETTASSMTWTLYLLALYPEQQEKAYEEVMNICSTEQFTVENTKQLKFVANVYKESLRLYPPVSFMPREIKEETKMRDKVMKKGASIVVSPWLMHRNANYWKDPHMFNPHRFDDPKSITKYTYFPFGMGPRVCIGSGFAMQESILLLATILRDFRLELESGFVPDIAGRLTIRSTNGMPIKLIKRNEE